MAEGIRGMDGVTLGSQAERAEGSKTTMETEQLLRDQILLKEEAGGGQSREPKGHISEGEIQKLQEEEDARIGAQRTEIQETYPGLDDSSGQEGQQTLQIPTVAMPGPSESAEATAGAPGDVHSNWNEVRASAGPQEGQAESGSQFSTVLCVPCPAGPAPWVPPGCLCPSESCAPLTKFLTAALKAFFPTNLCS